MPASLRPLSTGQLLDRSFQVYRQNFTLFAGISAVPNVCLLVIQLGMLAVTGSHPKDVMSTALLTGMLALVMILVAVVVSAISTAATTFGVSDVYLEKPTSISACFGRVKGKTGKVVYTSIEYGLRVGVGFVLLIIPGIYWAGKYGLAVPSVVLEDIKAKESFKRSAALTKDSVGRIVAIYFLTYILIFMISVGFSVLLASVAPGMTKAAGTISSEAFQYLLNTLINTLITPVMAIALTLAYYDQRVRKEAFDIENMMSLLGEPSQGMASGATAGS